MQQKIKFLDKIEPNTVSELQVSLGIHSLRAFVAAPRFFNIIGVVRLGMEYGLLAELNSGEYAKVNGSNVELLNNSMVIDAIYRYQNFSQKAASMFGPKVAAAPSASEIPVISIKKRRQIASNFNMPTIDLK